MSTRIRYAYLKGHTWLYRRNYPVDVALALGSKAYKQSLKTGSASEARVRAAEVNAQFETLVSQVRSKAEVALSDTPGRTAWGDTQNSALGHLRATLAAS